MPRGHSLLTVWRELVPLKHSDAQDLLLQVFDEELAVGVPLGIQSVLDRLGDVALGPHGHLAVRVTLSWREQSLLVDTAGGACAGVTALGQPFPPRPSLHPPPKPHLMIGIKTENPGKNSQSSIIPKL